jgi:hypothetical protein
VQLIAASVVLTVLVKQLVDYQFNAATATLGSRRSDHRVFQGKFNAATQWLPLRCRGGDQAGARPLGRRCGAPHAAVEHDRSEPAHWPARRPRSRRHREGDGDDPAVLGRADGARDPVLPVSDAIRARAKPRIDVGLESGLAKALSAG